MKTVLVLASGGFDSTYLIMKNLREGNCVIPLYIKSMVDSYQRKYEIKALQAIVSEFQKLYPKKVKTNKFSESYLCDFIQYESNFWCGGYHGFPLQQPIVWMLGAASFINKDTTPPEIDEIQLGYVMEDHALSWLKEIKKLFKAIMGMSMMTHFAVNGKEYKLPKVTFPIIKLSKYDIYGSIERDCPSIFKLCVTCETPNEDGSACGHCHSCEVAQNHGLKNLTPKYVNDDKVFWPKGKLKKIRQAKQLEFDFMKNYDYFNDYNENLEYGGPHEYFPPRNGSSINSLALMKNNCVDDDRDDYDDENGIGVVYNDSGESA
jgi:7-cyano-7-deazaguanine synthase in queuosine biosynthesis